MLDTGATCTLMHEELWSKVKAPNEQLKAWKGEPFYLANGEKIYPYGITDLDYCFHGLTFWVPTAVMTSYTLAYSLVLGLDFISITGLNIHVQSQRYCVNGVWYPFQPGNVHLDNWTQSVQSNGSVSGLSTSNVYTSAVPMLLSDTQVGGSVTIEEERKQLVQNILSQPGLSSNHKQELENEILRCVYSIYWENLCCTA